MTLTTRSGKGSALTHSEMDANWSHVVDSANHTFLQSGSLAISSDLQSRIRSGTPIDAAKDFGLSASQTAAQNVTSFTNALTEAIASFRDLYIPPAVYPWAAFTYTLTGSDNKTLPKIYGPRAMTGETSGKVAYFDCSGLTGSDVAFHFVNSASGGAQVVGMTLENIGAFGPSRTGSTTFLRVSGTAGIRYLTLRNLVAEGFGTGANIAGPNGYGLYTEGCRFERNNLGVILSNIEASVHNGLSTLESTRGLALDRVGSITFNSPILQSQAAANTRPVLIDLGTGNSSSIVFNAPYFEGNQEACFSIGYNSAGTSSTGNAVWGIQVNGGTYDSLEILDTASGVGNNSHSHDFKIITLSAGFSDPSSLVTGDKPRNSTFRTSRGQAAVSFYYDESGNLVYAEPQIDASGTSSATSGTGEDTTKTTTIAANRLRVGDVVRIVGAGRKTGGAGNKTGKFYFGATSFTFQAAANDTNDWRFEADIVVATSTAQRISCFALNGTTTAFQDFESAAEDITGAIVTKITWECANGADEVSQILWTVTVDKRNF